MVVLIQCLEKVNGHLVIVTPTGKRFKTNGRLTIKHADPARFGHEPVDVPLFRRHRQQIVCESAKAEIALRQLLVPVIVDKMAGRISALPDDVRGLVIDSLPLEILACIDAHTGNVV